MKIIVAIVVFNRYQNLERWLRCWKKCNQIGELIIIHTGDERNKFKSLCDLNNVQYIPRKNVGYDIGSFQDVCKERLPGFPNDWEYMLWITDDTLPMSVDFISPFIYKLQDIRVGVSCMQISASVSPHVRTTGFCLRKETSKLIAFPADPITTKQQCYFFEHRGGNNTFTNQIRAMGLNCVAVSTNMFSPLWDSGYWRRLDREAEHEAIFSGSKVKGNKVTIICTIYNTYPQIISSLILQTHTNWELFLIHDGPNNNGLKSYIHDERIHYIETKERVGNWGHSLRQWALNEFDLGDYVVVQNADNYLTPNYIFEMLKGFENNHTVVATYSEKMVHSYKNWDVILCKLERGFLDCGGVMVKSDIAKEVGWRDTVSHSSDWTYFEDIAARYSWQNFQKVKGCLFIHN